MVTEWVERATSFGRVAADYDRYRPAPPPEAASWMIPDGARLVADLCAGTGLFSRVVAAQVPRVVAIELDLRMAEILAGRSPGVLAVNASGEVLPIRNGVLDAVVVSSGWHWLDGERAVPEAARVLRPGGHLAVVWGGPARDVPWIRDLLGGPMETPMVHGRTPRELRIPAGQPFSPPESTDIRWMIERTPDELIGMAGTYSRVITMSAEERRALAQRAVELLATHPDLRGRDRIALPMAARCWRAVRSDGPAGRLPT